LGLKKLFAVWVSSGGKLKVRPRGEDA